MDAHHPADVSICTVHAARLFYFDMRQEQQYSNLIWFGAFGFTD